ncbi:MAG: hypothetical protein WC905_01685, partial [Patescibacteria group bacterium]
MKKILKKLLIASACALLGLSAYSQNPTTTIGPRDIWYFSGINNLRTRSINIYDSITLAGITITNWYQLYETNKIDTIEQRVILIENKTNDWNAAYGWGDHAGLYKASDWVPSWGDLTDIPQDFPPSTHEHDYTAVTNPPWLTEYTETDEIALSRVTPLEGGTNNWNTAFGWGDHAGLYKAIGWVPSW